VQGFVIKENSCSTGMEITMPHITIKCYKGRTEEAKKEIAEKLSDYAAEVFGLQSSSISVAIEEVEKEDWKQVYDEEIVGKKETLYKAPGYTME
jgi:4-oxalocrotonate tautomerase